MVFMPVKIEKHSTLNPQQNYVFVANHFSYLDVAIGMKSVRHYFSYMGKSSVKNIPLLGYMFAKLHIQVDRSEKDSRAKALTKSLRALKEGRSLFIMPEGGIISQNIPVMHQPFKDGAFNLAKEAGVPIVPICLVNMYEIMPEKSLNWGLPKVIINSPIDTQNQETEELKKQVYAIIQKDLNKYYKI
jgi:1-acyl-sn-glycerol-3-phosphate acyltransferase